MEENGLVVLTEEYLMSKISTSSWGGTRKSPYAFTELGIYSLMMVLKGDLAVKQSKKLIRLFKKLKDFAIQIQNVLPSTELQTLAIQTQNNSEDIRKIKQIMVTHDELSVIIKDFTNPNLKKDYLLYNIMGKSLKLIWHTPKSIP